MGQITRRLAKAALGAALALSLSLPSAPAVAQEKKVRANLAGSFASTIAILGPAQHRLVKMVKDQSGGSIDLRFYEPGALLPGSQYFDAISNGALDMAFTALGNFSGRDSSFPIFNTVPFGADVGELLAWMEYGGGKQLLAEVVAPHNVVALQCGLVSQESSGWFRKEIKTVEELKGLKMRFFGLGANVMSKLGVATQMLQVGEVFQALQLGTIDAAELGSPAMDLTLGFHQVAKFYYFPGWHQPTTMIQLLIGKAKWAEFSDTQKSIIQNSCKAQMLDMFTEAEGSQVAALRELVAKGVMIKKWSPEVMAALQGAWAEVVKEESAKSANFAKVWNSMAKFNADFAIWRDLSFRQ